MELFKLFGTVLIDDKDAIQSLKDVDNKGKETKTGLQAIADKGTKIGAAVIAGTGVAIGALMGLANSTAETADKWDKLSLRTGIAVESLQEWGYAAGQSGADISVLETGMKKLSDTMVNAQNGSKSAMEAYEQLGISMEELNTMTPEDAFNKVMYSLAEMEDGALKNSIGNDLLGKSYVELKPLIASGADGMQQLKDRANELGIVMSADAVTSGVVFGDTLADAKASLDGVKNKIVADLIPQLTAMLNWFVEQSPKIQEVGGAVLGFISDTIGFITDNSNILIPVLGGLLGAFLALQAISTVNALMTAWKTSTLAATLAQGGLNAVMMANPIAIVIAAIAALIAIGIALVMNWDKVKAKAQELWKKITEVFNGIKEGIGKALDAVKTKVTSIFDSIKSGVSEKVNTIKTTLINTFTSAKDKVVGIFTGIGTSIGEKVNAVKTTISNVFGTVKDIMSKPFETARDTIKTVIDKVKGFLNFNWEFPKLKMPHFKVSGSMNPMKWIEEGVPKLSVDWYAKGGIFSKPTIFNTPYGMKGVGDAKSPEVVAPLDNLKEMLGINQNDGLMRELISAINNFASRDNVLYINGKEVVRQTVDDMSVALNDKNKSYSRSRGVRK